jgi:hypothetical protein
LTQLPTLGSEKKNLKKGTNLAMRMNNNLLKDRLYLSIQKTPNPEELLSILPKIATTTVQLLSKATGKLM